MIASLIAGTVLTILTIGIHSSCTMGWLGFLRSRESNIINRRFGNFLTLSSTAIALLLTHTLEVTLWATAYFWLVGTKVFDSFESAVYFSTVTFTSLGYGDIVIDGRWRLLSAFQALTGILILGWSTALLFTVVQSIMKRKFE